VAKIGKPRPKQRRAPNEAARANEAEKVPTVERFYAVIRKIPRGRVTTYGAVAALAGAPRAARQVGFALARVIGPSRGLPWQRVLGAQSRSHAHITIRDPSGGERQRALLEAEGVRFDANGRVRLDEFGWRGPEPAAPGGFSPQARSKTRIRR
jgi:methylated-DNA-protein-cysteine methyltransferase-like protein